MSLHALEKLKAEYRREMPQSSGSHIEDDMDAMKHKIEKRKQKQKRQKTVFFTLIALAGLFAVLFGYSQYKLYVLSQEEVANTLTTNNSVTSVVTINASSTPDQVIKALGRHILLPAGNPQIAQIQDVTKLKDTQAFFKDAENGDIVVVYETMIYVYRPSKDVLVATSDISGVGQTKP